jgi:hypothetical protein
MSGVQLRRYEVKRGEFEQFVTAWRDLVPIRERYGFEVLWAFINAEESEFTWAVRHDGDFEAVEREYYADPERDTVGARASAHLEATHVAMVREVQR